MIKSLFILLLFCLVQTPSAQELKLNNDPKLLNEAAFNSLRANQYDDAFRKASLARHVALFDNRKKDLALSLKIIGTCFFYLSDYKNALQYYHQSLDIYQDVQDSEGTVDTLSNIGITYLHLSDYEKAMLYQSKLIEQIDLVEPGVKIKAYGNLGYIQFKANDIIGSEETFSKAKRLIESLKDEEKNIYLLLMEGEMKRSLNDIKSSLKLLNQAESISKRLGKKELTAAAQLEILKSLSFAGEQKEVLLLAKKLLDSNHLTNKDKLKELYALLALASKSDSQFQQALDYKEKELALNNEIFDNRAKQHANILAIEFQLRENRESIDQLKTTHQDKETSLNNKIEYLQYLSLILSILLIASAITNLILHKKKSP